MQLTNLKQKEVFKVRNRNVFKCVCVGGGGGGGGSTDGSMGINDLLKIFKTMGNQKKRWRGRRHTPHSRFLRPWVIYSHIYGFKKIKVSSSFFFYYY